MTYVELSYEVISKFVQPEDIPADNLKDILHRSFSTFRTPGNYFMKIFLLSSLVAL